MMNWRAFTLLCTSWLFCGAAKAEPPSASTALRACLDQTVNTDDRQILNTAIEICTRALLVDKLAPTERAEALAHRGVAYRNAKALDKSLDDLFAARALAPTDASVSRMLAWTYRTMGRYSEAEEEYSHALKLEAHWQVYLSRCVVRIDQTLYDKALSDCEIALKMNPSPDSIYFTGWLYAKAGRQADAMRVLEPAIGTSMASGRIYGELARVYDVVGRGEDAKRIREDGRRLFPNDPELN
jgi:tetratricopeptide (TPR) repeat protein